MPRPRGHDVCAVIDGAGNSLVCGQWPNAASRTERAEHCGSIQFNQRRSSSSSGGNDRLPIQEWAAQHRGTLRVELNGHLISNSKRNGRGNRRSHCPLCSSLGLALRTLPSNAKRATQKAQTRSANARVRSVMVAQRANQYGSASNGEKAAAALSPPMYS